MGTVCQACGYERKPTDQAPDWQCPACGKAYAKTLQEPHRPLAPYEDDPSGEPDDEPHEDPWFQMGLKAIFSDRSVWLKALVCLLLFAFFPVVSVLSGDVPASDLILHSDLGSTAFLAVTMTAIAVVGKVASARVDFNDPRSVLVFAAPLIGIALVLIFLPGAISRHNQAHDDARIRYNGLRARAEVVHVYQGVLYGTRAIHSYYVEYAFVPSGQTESVHGYAWLGDDGDPHVDYARSNGQVPIAYEVGHPEVSELNFDDEVFRRDYGASPGGMGSLLIRGVLVVVAVVVFLNWLRSRGGMQQ